MADKASQSRGFCSSSTAPSRFTRPRISGPALPLITNTGMFRVFVEFFRRFNTSIPEPPGMLMSRIIMVGWVRIAVTHAWIASKVAITSSPRSCSHPVNSYM